jgi:hypothetical protein
MLSDLTAGALADAAARRELSYGSVEAAATAVRSFNALDFLAQQKIKVIAS